MMIEQCISQLVIGSFVVAISKQKGKLKLRQSVRIKSHLTIEHLRTQGVESVLIDPRKQQGIPQQDASEPKSKVALLACVNQAKALMSQSKDIQKRLFEDVKNGSELDLSPVKEITAMSVDSLFNNPDALHYVINLRLKDEYLLEHSMAVSVLVGLFSRYLGIEKAIIKELSIGAFLHDIGKIMIPDEVLHKPSKLTQSEFELMKQHVNFSVDIIEKIPSISDLSLNVAAQHHEKLNGTGYPYGLAGGDISYYGRIIAICDIFDALTANRCYKSGFTQVKAFGILRTLAKDNQLDASLVDSFIKCMGVYPVGSIVQLENGELALVDDVNPVDAIKPKIITFYDTTQDCFIKPRVLDIALSANEVIIKCVRAESFGLAMPEILEFLGREL